jgi:hypothetical protein
VAVSGLGAGTGRVTPEICAGLMWAAYGVLREQRFQSFAEMRAALEEQIGVATYDGHDAANDNQRPGDWTRAAVV